VRARRLAFETPFEEGMGEKKRKKGRDAKSMNMTATMFFAWRDVAARRPTPSWQGRERKGKKKKKT